MDQTKTVVSIVFVMRIRTPKYGTLTQANNRRLIYPFNRSSFPFIFSDNVFIADMLLTASRFHIISNHSLTELP